MASLSVWNPKRNIVENCKTCNFALIQFWSAANSSRINTNGLISRRLVGVRALSTVVKDLTLTWVWAFLNIKEDVKRQTSQNFALWTISKVAAHVLTMQILYLSRILTRLIVHKWWHQPFPSSNKLEFHILGPHNLHTRHLRTLSSDLRHNNFLCTLWISFMYLN